MPQNTICEPRTEPRPGAPPLHTVGYEPRQQRDTMAGVMSHTVFFSWQSDTPTSEGRNFIQKALETAVANIADDASVEAAVREELTVDKDTKDVPGSPPIFPTILSKIDRASVFVADLTLCATRPDKRLSPNPNVLIEYGWALKSLGYHQILAVMNTAHGEPTRDSLPFDLADLRFPIRYSLPDSAPPSARQRARDQLAKQLEGAIRAILNSHEFKEKLPKEPEPPPFPRKTPKWKRANFRGFDEPLGYDRDPVGPNIRQRAEGRVFLLEGPAMWLRLMPRYSPGRTWLTQEIKRPAVNLAGLPLMEDTQSYAFLQGDDGGGYYSKHGNSQTYSVAYVFNTGEIWIVNSGFGRTKEFAFREDAFTETLDRCARFLESLGCAKPYQWVVGLEGFAGRTLYSSSPPHRPLGACISDLIEREGTYKVGDTAAELLRPFFEAVFDRCGARREAP